MGSSLIFPYVVNALLFSVTAFFLRGTDSLLCVPAEVMLAAVPHYIHAQCTTVYLPNPLKCPCIRVSGKADASLQTGNQPDICFLQLKVEDPGVLLNPGRGD